MSRITRRDFLKTSAALAASTAFAGAAQLLSPARVQETGKPNILIFVFDAMSARHLSLHGYARRTTPNLERFAERASVYHRHHSASNFTTSGTASMLTGMYPWTHRAINYRGMIDRHLTDRNLFKLIGAEYTRFAFTQNLWADILLNQFQTDLDIHPPPGSYSRFYDSSVQPEDLPSDRGIAYYAFQDFLNLRVVDSHPFPGSLLIATADLVRALTSDWKHISDQYPRGLPTNYDYSYEHVSVFDGMARLISSLLSGSAPYLAYFHLWSPHEPYNARREFVGRFDDGMQVPEKPHHPLAKSDYSEAEVRRRAREYDEFIADLDTEFGRLMADLERAGILQNSYVIVTSDHGEMFERGETGHGSALLYAPVTHIPLLISAPGQQSRLNIHSLTSNVDLAPTILQMAGKPAPTGMQGRLLPGFGGSDEAQGGIFSMVAKDNPAFRPLTHATFALLKGSYELLFHTGYPGYADSFDLYHLDEDPYELRNLFSKDITTASRMKDELLEAIDRANRNFQTKS